MQITNDLIRKLNKQGSCYYICKYDIKTSLIPDSLSGKNMLALGSIKDLT